MRLVKLMQIHMKKLQEVSLFPSTQNTTLQISKHETKHWILLSDRKIYFIYELAGVVVAEMHNVQ